MGDVLVSLNDEDEFLLRNLVREKHGGKKGALKEVVGEAIKMLAAKEKRLMAVSRVAEKTEKGFHFGLSGRKAYEKRSDIYD